jgi:FkbM family methyltransferase
VTVGEGRVREQLSWYRELVTLSGAVAVDVGANVGDVSAFFVEAGCARVVSVEPIPVLAAWLRRRAAASDRWAVLDCAVGPEAGEVGLAIGQGPGGVPQGVVVERGGALKVPCRTLHDVAADATVIKLDIEGLEHAVLDASLAQLPRLRALLVELHLVPGRLLSQTLGLLVGHGFELLGAGRRAGDASGRWVGVPVAPTLEWDALPVAQRRADGSVFKMLHVVARRGVT